MPGSEYLYTIAEVSVAFVGFASIVLAIRHPSGDIDPFDRLLVAWLIERGLAALAFALLPALLHHFGAPAYRIFPTSSGLLAGYFLLLVVRNFLLGRRHRHDFTFGLPGAAVRLVLIVAIVPIQALAALGLLPFSALGWYLLGVSWLLLQSGALFSTILTARAA